MKYSCVSHKCSVLIKQYCGICETSLSLVLPDIRLLKVFNLNLTVLEMRRIQKGR